MEQNRLNQKTIILITVDVEARMGNDPVNNLIWGDLKEGFYGIPKIMDICDEFSIKATFFVDIAELKTHGMKAMRDVFNTISNRGHDIQMHVHPDHWADHDRLFLWEYTFNEQIQIISECKELFRKILGKNPIAFRAGKLAANYDTLNVLEKCKIPVDSSLHFPSTVINYPIADATMIKNILEVPITWFKGFRLSNKNTSFTRYEPLDINYSGLREMKFVIDSAIKKGMIVLVLNLHSYSFVRKCILKNHYKPNYRDMDKFKKILNYIKTKDNLEALTITQFYDKFKNKEYQLKPKGIISYNNMIDCYIQTFRRTLKTFKNSTKAKIFVAGNIIIIALLISLVTFLILGRGYLCF